MSHPEQFIRKEHRAHNNTINVMRRCFRLLCAGSTLGWPSLQLEHCLGRTQKCCIFRAGLCFFVFGEKKEVRNELCVFCWVGIYELRAFCWAGMYEHHRKDATLTEATGSRSVRPLVGAAYLYLPSKDWIIEASFAFYLDI